MWAEQQPPPVGVEIAFRQKFGSVLVGRIAYRSEPGIWVVGGDWPNPDLWGREVVLSPLDEDKPHLDFGWVRLPAGPERDIVLDAFHAAVALTC